MKNLIVTNPEVFYRSNLNNIMLGEWCYLNIDDYKRFENIEKFGFYHWDNYKKKKKDYKYLNNLIDRIISVLKQNINSTFGVNHTKRFYSILLLPWLTRYVFYIFDRWEIINTFSKKYPNASANLYKFQDRDFIPLDTERSLYQNNVSDWNHWVFGKIIQDQNKININFIEKKKIETSKKIQIKKKKKFIFNSLLKFLSSNKIFIKDFQFPRIKKMFFHLQMKNFIFAPEEINYPNFKEDMNMRDKIFTVDNFNDSFENFLMKILKISLPKVFLEGYEWMTKISNKLTWPKKPQFILTSFAFQSDEIFKYYTALNVELNNSKYIISQHGGSWGILDFKAFENTIPVMCDKFLTWGHNSNKNTVPLFITKNIKKNKLKKQNANGLLIPVTEFEVYPTMLETIRSRRDTINYLNDFDKLMLNLNENIYSKTVIKYRNPFTAVKIPVSEKKGILNDGFFFQKENLDKKYKEKVIVTDETSLYLSKKFKLIVELVNGTGFLECLANNIPVILIISPQHNFLNDYAKKYYKKLKDVNIYFENFVQASNFINKNYYEIDLWWNSVKLQEIKNEFVDIFAKNSNSKINELKKVITN